jgi:hypothetical protein
VDSSLEVEGGVEGSFGDNFKAEVGLFRCNILKAESFRCNFKAESFSDNQPVKYTIVPSNSKCAHPDEDDDASLMMEDHPNDSSFGDIEMSFDMNVLEETIKMYD